MLGREGRAPDASPASLAEVAPFEKGWHVEPVLLVPLIQLMDAPLPRQKRVSDRHDGVPRPSPTPHPDCATDASGRQSEWLVALRGWLHQHRSFRGLG